MIRRPSLNERSIISDLSHPRRLGLASLGLLGNRVLHRQLHALGYQAGLPGPYCDAIAVWGGSQVTDRARWLARQFKKPLIWLEDAPLRSLHPQDRHTFGLSIDRVGLWCGGGVSELARSLDLAAPAEPEAPDLRALLQHYRLSKYNLWPADGISDLPKRFVLICDQRRGDAAIRGAGASAQDFQHMLSAAIAEYPELPILIRGHPRGGGHFSADDLPKGVLFSDARINPWEVLARAEAVYAVSSQLGLEAIWAGHRPRLFGASLYAGRGLSEDRVKITGRSPLTVDQLFSDWMMRYPHWIDPSSGKQTDLETILARLDGAARAASISAHPLGLSGISLWKRRRIKEMFASPGVRHRFTSVHNPSAGDNMRPAIWASHARALAGGDMLRIEDGPLRSKGLGAALVPALSLFVDDLGIAFDATRPSRFEAYACAAPKLPNAALQRAARLRQSIIAAELTKYNLNSIAAPPPDKRWTLVVGQVGNDASLIRGMGSVEGNAALLRAAREAFPDAQLLYRPHPDVLAGLRPGALSRAEEELADAIDPGCSLAALWPKLDRVVTLTSTLGFEAVLRGIPVTCFGWPFYAGWGLTTDLGVPGPERRRSVVLSPDQLTHAVLIDAALYFDPVMRRACDPETVVERLRLARSTEQGFALRLLSKVQGALASIPFWR